MILKKKLVIFTILYLLNVESYFSNEYQIPVLVQTGHGNTSFKVLNFTDVVLHLQKYKHKLKTVPKPGERNEERLYGILPDDYQNQPKSKKNEKRLYNILPNDYKDQPVYQKELCPSEKWVKTLNEGTYEVLFDIINPSKIVGFKPAHAVRMTKCVKEVRNKRCCLFTSSKCKTVKEKRMFAKLMFNAVVPTIVGEPHTKWIGIYCKCM